MRPSPTTPTRAIFAWIISRARTAHGSCKVSDRKETGVNYPTLPLPLDGQTNGAIKIHDQQVALGYTHLMGANKVLDARVGSVRDEGRQVLAVDRRQRLQRFPGCRPSDGLRRSALHRHLRRFHGLRTAEHESAVAEPSLLDPKVNYTWIKGKHSLKFGYEYEHIWMAVKDNQSAVWLVHLQQAKRMPARTERLRRYSKCGQLLGRLPLRQHQHLLAGDLLYGSPAADHG